MNISSKILSIIEKIISNRENFWACPSLFIAGMVYTKKVRFGKGARCIMDQLLGLAPILLMFVAMWFILIRPAKKRQQQTQNMQSSLQRGDKVITIGGLHGVIDAIEDTAITLKIADNVRVKFDRQAIGRVVNDN